MRVRFTSGRPVLRPSTLLDFTYELDVYRGCEHNCRYCYIHDEPGIDAANELILHSDFLKHLVRELDALEPQTIYIGMDTDPYQPAEKEYRHLRQALQVFGQRGFSVCILTKSDLVTRDIDLLRDMPGSSVGISVSFHDETDRVRFEDRAPSTERRIDGLRQVRKAGIETYALISPVMPMLTDAGRLIDRLAPVANTIWIYRLHADDETAVSWRNTQAILKNYYPDLVPGFAEIVLSRNHRYWTSLEAALEQRAAAGDVRLEIHI